MRPRELSTCDQGAKGGDPASLGGGSQALLRQNREGLGCSCSVGRGKLQLPDLQPAHLPPGWGSVCGPDTEKPLMSQKQPSTAASLDPLHASASLSPIPSSPFPPLPVEALLDSGSSSQAGSRGSRWDMHRVKAGHLVKVCRQAPGISPVHPTGPARRPPAPPTAANAPSSWPAVKRSVGSRLAALGASLLCLRSVARRSLGTLWVKLI